MSVFGKVIEILKDRPSWFRDCRSLEVFTMFPAGNGGTIELVYMQVGNFILLHSWCLFSLSTELHDSFCGCYHCYIPTDVCPDNFSPCTWFLDVTIHNNNGRWQPCGMCESELHFYFFSLIMNEPGHIFANLPPSLRSVRDPWVVLGVVQMQPLHINL